jgi:cytochrome c oxidase assembly protein subunit 15
MHRWWAWVVVTILILFARKVRKVPGARSASIAVHTAFGIQIIFGILTVLSGIAIGLAVLHQATGALLVAATVWGAHELGRSRR